MYTWGKGARGRLGRKEEDSGIPKAVQLDESHPFVVTSVACCHGNSLLAVKRNISLITPLLTNTARCWDVVKSKGERTNPQMKDRLNLSQNRMFFHVEFEKGSFVSLKAHRLKT